MVSAKQLADFGYKTFSSSMMLLTLYGGYLCSVNIYHMFQKKKQLTVQETNAETRKD